MAFKFMSVLVAGGIYCGAMPVFAEEQVESVILANEQVDVAIETVESRILAKIHSGYQMSVLAVILTNNNAADKRVKDYAIAIMRQQKVAEDAVQQISSASSIPIVPFTPVTPDEMQHAKVSRDVGDRLQELDGHAFDINFLKALIAENEWTMGWLQAQQPKIENAFVRALVEGYLVKALETRKSAADLLKDLDQ